MWRKAAASAQALAVDDVDAQLRMVYVFLSERQVKQAVEQARWLCTQNPADHRVHTALATALFVKGDRFPLPRWVGLIAILALGVAPALLLLLGLQRLWWLKNRRRSAWAEATEHFEVAARLNPADAGTLLIGSELRRGRGDARQSLDYLAMAAHQSPHAVSVPALRRAFDRTETSGYVGLAAICVGAVNLVPGLSWSIRAVSIAAFIAVVVWHRRRKRHIRSRFSEQAQRAVRREARREGLVVLALSVGVVVACGLAVGAGLLDP